MVDSLYLSVLPFHHTLCFLEFSLLPATPQGAQDWSS